MLGYIVYAFILILKFDYHTKIGTVYNGRSFKDVPAGIKFLSIFVIFGWFSWFGILHQIFQIFQGIWWAIRAYYYRRKAMRNLKKLLLFMKSFNDEFDKHLAEVERKLKEKQNLNLNSNSNTISHD
jgi:hypothetical protein